MKKTYLVALFAGCILCMPGCSNQVKDKANDPDVPAVTEETGLTEGAADVAGQETGGSAIDPSGTGITDKKDGNTSGKTGDEAKQTAVTNGKSQASDKASNTQASKKADNNKETAKKSATGKKKDIGIEAAKKIALEKAGLTEQDGSWKEQKKDQENGLAVYELEFVSRDKEYEFEINAENGIILEYQQDTIDD